MKIIKDYSNRRGWRPEEDDILRANYGIVPIHNFIHLLPNRTPEAIQLHATRYLGLTASNIAIANLVHRRWYQYNESFFSTICPLVSYWAGFIAADGCVGSPIGGIGIHLADKDRTHLEQLCLDMQFTRPVGYRPDRGRGGPQCELTICCLAMISDIWRNYGIGPRKSLTLTAPRHLDIDNTLAFIIGYIDGDGCIRHRKGEGRGRDYIALKILGTPDLLNWIADTFCIIAPSIPPEARPRPTKYHIWTYEVAGHRVEHILNRLLSIDVPKMARKWDIVRNFQTAPLG
jgi:hypothetical protein